MKEDVVQFEDYFWSILDEWDKFFQKISDLSLEYSGEYVVAIENTLIQNESPKKQYSESSGNKENSGQRNQTYRNDESSSKQKSYEQPKSPKPRDNAENQSYKGNSAEKNKRNSGSQRDGGRPRNWWIIKLTIESRPKKPAFFVLD